MMANIFNANNSVIIIEKTSFHSCFHKAAPIGVEKLAYARLFKLSCVSRLYDELSSQLFE
jgi:hypothetical protein